MHWNEYFFQFFDSFGRTKMLALHLRALLFIISIGLQAHKVALANNTEAKKPNQHPSNEDMTTPSPEWLEYQRERFGNTKDIESLKKLLDPASQLLKNKAGIIDPTSPPLKPSEISAAMATQPLKSYGMAAGEKVSNGDEPKDTEEISHDEEDEGEADDMRSKEGNTNIFPHVITGIQYPSMQGFLNFIRTVQRNWVRQSRLTIEQKIKKLKGLKNKIMRMIEDQFHMIWTPKVHMRRKRGLLDESNLNFPPEAALISINFLTFAVFLIKLVLQVVHIVKSKHYTLSGFGFTNTDTMTKST
ncbi:PREDICTED: uncharacterized protein LOC108369701 [Rhagoletis zephyria]|uniref:uncharacterized protein LOC108369701 n=1 Tax=Rhagoletis zephyria TaxID=28612 RepID=UPI0008117C0F|nr:PREDICTED: uncharacterized protein LOC108369701 [Rhagoletis zephyria]